MGLYRFALQNLPRTFLIRASYGFRLFAPILLKGRNVECPICKNQFKRFLSYGSKKAQRPNVLCPYCLSLERHRLLWLYLNQKTNFFTAPLKVLHIAPEQCFYHRFKRLKNIEYVTGDLESPLAQHHFDLHDIPFDDHSFEVVLCNHVMEHVEDYHQCMTELHRVMKPGGWAIMQVPIDHSNEKTYEDMNITSPAEREEHFWQKDHLRLFGRDYPKKLEEAGFKVRCDEFAADMDKELSEKFRLQQKEIIYFAQK
jgi:SAM-dependent methyltransferase